MDPGRAGGHARADGRLSLDGKRAGIAKAWVACWAAVEQVRTADQADERRRLERTLFGVDGKDPTALIVHRDAADRAEATKDPAQASALLTRATRSGDKVLGRAVLRVALDRGWSQAAEEWIKQNPAWANDVHAMLEERTRSRIDRAPSVLADSMFGSVDRPAGHLSDASIESLAKQ